MKIGIVVVFAVFVGQTVGQDRFNLIQQIADNMDQDAVRKAMAKIIRAYSRPENSGKRNRISKSFRKQARD